MGGAIGRGPEGREGTRPKGSRATGPPVWGLRGKFFAASLAITLITCLVVYVSIYLLQSSEEERRLRKEALLFSQFASEKIVQDFTRSFYFAYREQYLPAVDAVLGKEENLSSFRIVSVRTGSLLFDSADRDAFGGRASTGDGPREVVYPEAIRAEIEKSQLAATLAEDDLGEPFLQVVALYARGPGLPSYLVEYRYRMRSLERSLAALRRQLLIDLVPSLVIGLAISLAFAQLLISPIRRLVGAIQRVAAGDLDLELKVTSRDELGFLIRSFNSMTEGLRKREELRRFLSGSAYRQVVESEEAWGGSRPVRRIDATILYSDIKGFTGLCEAMDAEEVTRMLTDYFDRMVEAIHRNGGEVDKFIGDGILALFHAEDRTAESSALAALFAALDMRAALEALNRERAARGATALETGIGITHGEVILGPVGSSVRSDFTVVGDRVNLAARIEKLSREGKHTRIVFSSHVEERLRGLIESELLARERVRGKDEIVPVFELKKILSLDSLVPSLSDANPSRRARGLELIGRTGSREGISLALHALEDESESVRVAAAGAIGSLLGSASGDGSGAGGTSGIGNTAGSGDPGGPGGATRVFVGPKQGIGESALPEDIAILAKLLSRATGDPSERVRASLVAAFGSIARGEALLDLERFLGSSDERVVANAVEALGRCPFERAEELILQKLSNRSPRIKANAALALFSRGKLSVIHLLKPWLLSPEPGARASAAYAIGELALKARFDDLASAWRDRRAELKLFLAELQECVPILVSLLADPAPAARRQAVVALGKLRDRSAILPLIGALEPGRGSGVSSEILGELEGEIARALQSIGAHQLAREVSARLG